jgi:hypothetical protein
MVDPAHAGGSTPILFCHLQSAWNTLRVQSALRRDVSQIMGQLVHAMACRCFLQTPVWLQFTVPTGHMGSNFHRMSVVRKGICFVTAIPSDQKFCLYMLLIGGLSAVTGIAPGFLGQVWPILSIQALNVFFAPLSVAVDLASAVLASYCPVHELLSALTFPYSPLQQTSGVLSSLTLQAYDLPLPADTPSCVVPTVGLIGGSYFYFHPIVQPTFTVTLSTEPVFLQRSLLGWMSSVESYPQSSALRQGRLVYAAPPFGLYSPSLNSSYSISPDHFCSCSQYLTSAVLPALPWTGGQGDGAQMPFPPQMDSCGASSLAKHSLLRTRC